MCFLKMSDGGYCCYSMCRDENAALNMHVIVTEWLGGRGRPAYLSRTWMDKYSKKWDEDCKWSQYVCAMGVSATVMIEVTLCRCLGRYATKDDEDLDADGRHEAVVPHGRQPKKPRST